MIKYLLSDHLGNIVKKILPQCQYSQYWYDHGDKVTFMQDTNLRTKNKYRFMLYDRMGRLCVQGLCDGFDRSANVSNGNIEHLQRRGRKQDGHVGKIDNLSIFHHGNQLSSVVDDAAKIYYAGIFNFNGDGKNEAHYKYNESGSLTEDTGRGITNIEYDDWNNPKRIQFANGNVTKYVYSADGEKLRTVHYTAVPNISVPAGTTHRLSTSEILSKDSTDYHGNLIVENGKPDKYLYTGGFASLRNIADGKPEIAFHYYDQDHLGNNRAVVSARTGAVEQITNYYPFGMPYTDQTAVSPDFQKYKYNGKELDKMHGLNTYDYGARQYYSIVPAWDRIDPMCEKYYDISPYAYCGNNPENVEDPDGRDSYYTQDGKFAFVNTAKTDNIYIISGYKQVGESEDKKFIYYEVYDRKTIDQTPNFLSALAYSRIFTNILERHHVFDAKYPIYNNAIQVFVGKQEGNNIYEYSSTGKDSNNEGWEQFAHTSPTSHKITANIWEHGYVDGKNSYSDNRFLFKTEHNVLSILGDHEYKGHRVNGWDEKKTYDFQLGSSIYESTTYDFQSFIKDNCVKND